MKIKIENNVYSYCSKDVVNLLLPLLQYDKVFWREGQYAKKKTNYNGYMIDKRNGELLTGLIPKVVEFLQKRGINFELSGYNEKIKPANKPKLKGIKFREDQLRLISNAVDKQRGVVLSPTGSGKTIIAMGIMSCYPKKQILFLCHTLDLLNQTHSEFKKYGFKSICLLGGGSKELDNSNIVISTIQTLSKFDVDSYCDRFDITIIDESHHVNSISSNYGKLLTNNLSPVKIGFTATLPEQKEKLLALEGLIGPVIGELTMEEGIEKGILAIPKVKLINTPYKPTDLRKYHEIYDQLIVNNRNRNLLVVKEVRDYTRENKSVLVIVKEIEHGDNLIKLADLIGLTSIIFIQGKTEGEQREKVKKALQDKKIKAVIATAIWREGINIPSLNVIVNAAGGKSEIMTLQAIGRGLRTSAGKEEVIIVDFLDPYRYLAEHSIFRLQIYNSQGWI